MEDELQSELLKDYRAMTQNQLEKQRSFIRFKDNAMGMDSQVMRDMLTLCGRSSKGPEDVKPNQKNFLLGENGMGFKINSLRLGDTILVLSSK